jgi:hypothetical protein
MTPPQLPPHKGVISADSEGIAFGWCEVVTETYMLRNPHVAMLQVDG